MYPMSSPYLASAHSFPHPHSLPHPRPYYSSSYQTMPRPLSPHSAASFLTDLILFVGGGMVGLILVWSLCSFVYDPTSSSNRTLFHSFSKPTPIHSLHDDPPARTFYDDQYLSYTIENKVTNWDEKRAEWLKLHPNFLHGVEDRVLLVTGSQSSPCKNNMGDHILLKFFKNKVDYCRMNGYDIFYNTALFHPKMPTFWAKIPLVRAAMIAHPEAEWIWWMDSDAAFTDMEFKLPLHKYRHHNMVVHGWPHLIYEKKSWVSLNAGVFMMRNCQWAIDFMDVWASMGPFKPEYDEWSKVLKTTFKDKIFPESDDQSALVYLLLKEKEKWADKIFLENEYYFEGYWVEIVGRLENITSKYMELERGVRTLRRRHAEKVGDYYGALREQYLGNEVKGKEGWRRPFVTHFAGCQPCSGDHNELYSGQRCWDSMQKALHFADNQVLRKYGFVHPDLLDQSVSPVPFDYPA